MKYRFCLCLLLLLSVATVVQAGRYQKTKDRQIKVWNEHPEQWDEAIWTGERDENGYATGSGVLTWYHISHSTQMGTLIPSSRGHNLEVARTFSGTMKQGRFDGTVATSEAGRKFQANFVDGSRQTPWTLAGQGGEKVAQHAVEQPKKAGADSATGELKPPAEGPSQVVTRSAVVEAPTQDSHTLELFRPPSSLRASYVTSQSSPQPAKPTDQSVANLQREADSVFAKVRDATANWRDIDSLDSVQALPQPVSSSIRSLGDHAKGIRSSTTPDSNTRIQTETADALAVVNESTRALAGKDASAADSKLVQFLKTHPSPPSDNQKELWRYIATARAVCERQRKEAETHLERAQLLLTANEVDPAIEEYNQANRIFPSQATTEKIRQLSARSTATSSPQ